MIRETTRPIARTLNISPAVLLPDSFIHRVGFYIRLYRFNTHYHTYAENVLRRSRKFVPLFKPLFEKYGFPWEVIWFIGVESSFNPNAISPAGAGGMFQFMPATAREYGLRVDEQSDERFYVMKAARAAAEYLKDLYLELGDMNLAFAAYNTGPNKVRRILKELPHIAERTFWELTAGDNALKTETREYLPQIYAMMTIARNDNARTLGIDVKDGPDTTDTHIVIINDTRRITPFKDSLTIKRILDLNPDLDTIEQLYREGYRNYPLRLPLNVAVHENKAVVVSKRLSPPPRRKKKKKRKPSFRARDVVERTIISPQDTLIYKVKRGNTLNMLARIFHSDVDALMKQNKLKFRSLRKNIRLRITPKVVLERIRYRIPHTARYTDLAQRFGVDFFDLKHINENKSATVAAGDTILVVRPYHGK